MNVTYKHRDGEEVIYSAPVPGLDAAPAWSRVEQEPAPTYAGLLKPALEELCEQRGLDKVGTVPELRDRLIAQDAEQS